MKGINHALSKKERVIYAKPTLFPLKSMYRERDDIYIYIKEGREWSNCGRVSSFPKG